MKKIIDNILTHSSFERIGTLDYGTLYRNSIELVNYYWLVITTDNLSTEFLDHLQDKYFNECARIARSPSFNKNTSMLILWECSTSEINKGLVQVIEEDPYQFKKYVIPYTDETLSDLSENIDEEISTSLTELLANNSVFQDYKNNYGTYNWRHLLYTIAHKLPFLDIHIDENQSIHNIEKRSNELIENDNLTNFYLQLTKFIEGSEFPSLDKMSMVDLLKKIQE